MRFRQWIINFTLGAVDIPEALHQAMWDAYDAMSEKLAHVARLEAGRTDIENDIAAAEQELTQAKADYVAGFGDIASGSGVLSQSAKDAKRDIGEISGRIVGYKETLPDFGRAIIAANAEMRPLRDQYAKARREIIKEFLKQVPRSNERAGDLNSVFEHIESGQGIDLGIAMTLYLAAHDGSTKELLPPFPTAIKNPDKFFAFMGQFFRSPSDEDIHVYYQRFNAAIWGDREPEPDIPMPTPEIRDDGFGPMGAHWDAVGTLYPI